MLTGSVSRGVADEVSDIEMLVVTADPLELAACFEHAGRAGLERLDTWGPQGTPTSRVFGYCEGVPIELVWWPHSFAEASVAALLRGEAVSAADALANGLVSADERPARALAGGPPRVPGRAGGGADRGRGADLGRLRARRDAHDHASGRAARARRADGRRRDPSAADRLCAQPRLAADHQACGSPGRSASGKARAPRGADRGGPHRARPVPRAARAEPAAARNRRARTERPQRRPRPRLAPTGAGSAPDRIAA